MKVYFFPRMPTAPKKKIPDNNHKLRIVIKSAIVWFLEHGVGGLSKWQDLSDTFTLCPTTSPAYSESSGEENCENWKLVHFQNRGNICLPWYRNMVRLRIWGAQMGQQLESSVLVTPTGCVARGPTLTWGEN